MFCIYEIEFTKFATTREMKAAFFLTSVPSVSYSSVDDTAKRGAFETIYQNIPSSWSKLSQNVSLKGYCINLKCLEMSNANYFNSFEDKASNVFRSSVGTLETCELYRFRCLFFTNAQLWLCCFFHLYRHDYFWSRTLIRRVIMYIYIHFVCLFNILI